MYVMPGLRVRRHGAVLRHGALARILPYLLYQRGIGIRCGSGRIHRGQVQQLQTRSNYHTPATILLFPRRGHYLHDLRPSHLSSLLPWVRSRPSPLHVSQVRSQPRTTRP